MIETKRIYKIREKDLYGIYEVIRPIIDEEGDIKAELQGPMATIRYENRIMIVEPYQVEFIEEE